MVYGIISDIHSNLDALQSALGFLKGVDRLVCPGDIVGYGPDPNECCDLLRRLGPAVVVGNHDAAVCGRMDTAWFNPDARTAAQWTREVISGENLRYLESLPASYSSDDFVLVHGSLAEPLTFPYVFSTSTARPCFERMDGQLLCLIGHTHVGEVYVQPVDGQGVDQLAYTRGGRVEMKPGFRYVANFGSVGQARDGNPSAACGIYDSTAGTLEFTRLPYDIGAVQERMRRVNLPEYLIHRLDTGE